MIRDRWTRSASGRSSTSSVTPSSQRSSTGVIFSMLSPPPLLLSPLSSSFLAIFVLYPLTIFFKPERKVGGEWDHYTR